MATYFGLMEMQGTGGPDDPRRLSDWQGIRLDFHCRMLRANLACNAAGGGTNSNIQAIFANVNWGLYKDCSSCFGCYAVDLPDDYAGNVSAAVVYANEPRPAGPLMANDPAKLQRMAHNHAVLAATALNNANFGFTIGSATPYADVVSALESFTSAALGPLSTALRTRYVTRLQGTNTGGFPASLLTDGTWNVTGMVNYANLLDSLPLSDPRNLIHILYELAGAMVLAATL